MNVLLLTGTIKPFVKVPYNNPEIRYTEYERNIQRYICESDFDGIVFAENSGWAFSTDKLTELAKIYGKKFEYLDLSETADKRNMSSGEAYMLREALEKSSLIAKTDAIWKVTGRIYIRNINKFIHGGYNKNVFLYSKSCDSVQTWFFRGKKSDLKKWFLNNETIEMMACSCIEYAWIDCWRKHKERIQIERFKEYPDAEGINSSGAPYTISPVKLFFKNIALRFGYFTVK